ncbi:MAG: FmdB family zinc ribbon protein [Sporichthyaceae bacterium]
MPTYQYACTACEHELEAVQKFTDDALTQCPACPGTLRKVFSAVGVVFKGSGFYRTDSRSGAGKDGAGASKPAASSGESGSGTSGSGGDSGSSAPAGSPTTGSSSSGSTSASGGSSGKTSGGESAA